MYQSILPTLKPLVFEGKSGLLEVEYRYNDRARFIINEGIIEQVETKNLEGDKAALACAKWASITITFVEGEHNSSLSSSRVDTNSILSYLEKVHKNINIINENIPDNSTIFQVDHDKLNTSGKLNVEDFKIALFLDGKNSVEEIIAKSDKSELAILAHICKLVLAGVARQIIQKDVMAQEAQDSFIQSLSALLVSLVGPAGPILLEDCFKSINSEPGMLAKAEIPALIKVIEAELDDRDKAELEVWNKAYFL